MHTDTSFLQSTFRRPRPPVISAIPNTIDGLPLGIEFRHRADQALRAVVEDTDESQNDNCLEFDTVYYLIRYRSSSDLRLVCACRTDFRRLPTRAGSDLTV